MKTIPFKIPHVRQELRPQPALNRTRPPTSENQIQSLSATRNVTISLEEGRHILGLSNPASGTVWVTELGFSRLSVFRVREEEQPSKIFSPKDFNGNSPLYLENLVFDQKTQNLFLTSGNTGSIFTLSTHHHPSTLSGPGLVNCRMRDNGCGLHDDGKF